MRCGLDGHPLLHRDSLAAHKHPAVPEWLPKYPRFHMHFTPTSASWLNMVERFFNDISENRLRRGVFTSNPEFATATAIDVRVHSFQATALGKGCRESWPRLVSATAATMSHSAIPNTRSKVTAAIAGSV